MFPMRSYFRRSVAVSSLAVALLAASGAASVRAQDPGEMIVRIGRLENQLRQMSGQIEQLQFENRRLGEQFRKFQEDVEFRLQDKAGGAGASPATPKPRRGAAFDPASDPGAPGAPRPIGSPQSASSTPGASGHAASSSISGLSTGGVRMTDDEGEAGASAGAPMDYAEEPRTSIASAPGAVSPRADYDTAYSALQDRRYDQAEMAFRQYIQSHPRDRLVPDATFWLGESYYQRERYREAAEQFLKVTTDYPKSGKGPDSLVKLGMSLNRIGAREQACATYGEVTRKYPSASPDVRSAVERERRRAKCA